MFSLRGEVADLPGEQDKAQTDAYYIGISLNGTCETNGSLWPTRNNSTIERVIDLSISVLDMTNRIFDSCFVREEEKREELLQSIRSDLVSNSEFYVLASENTSQERWSSGEYSLYVDRSDNLVAFVDRINAERYAKQNGFYFEQGDGVCTLVLELNRADFGIRLNEELRKTTIKNIKMYGKRPFYILCPLELFEAEENSTVLKEVPASEDPPTPIAPVEERKEETAAVEQQRSFVLVDDIKKFLDTAEVSVRRSINPGLSYENVHDVIEILIAKNQLKKEDVERELELPSGWLTTFCKDKTSTKTSKETLRKLLQYFGLGEYIYQYKNYCGELLRQLKEDRSIDIYEIRESTAVTNKEYKITSIKRGKLKKDGAYAYRLLLKSDEDELEVCVSTPRGYIVGREYEIVELDGKKSKPMPVSRNNPTDNKKDTAMPTNNPVSQRYVSRAEEKAKYGKSQEPNQTAKDINDIIRYLKEEYGDTAQAASQKILKLMKHEDIIKSFALYIRKKNPGKARSLDYTAGRLMNELHYEPYEAYCILADLRENPKETKQMLIYRERDPQYQT